MLLQTARPLGAEGRHADHFGCIRRPPLVTLDPSQFLAAAVITLHASSSWGWLWPPHPAPRRLGPAIFTHAGFNLIGVIALFVTAGG